MRKRISPLAPTQKWGLLFLCALALATYANALANPLIYDDKAIFLNSEGQLTLANVHLLFTLDFFSLFPTISVGYRPLSVFSYMLLNDLFGSNYAAWRLFYLIFHVANAFLLYHLVLRANASQTLAFLLSGIFCVHPIATEIVNQISFNEDSMVVFFCLSSLVLDRKRRPILSSTSLFLGMLTKETAILFPLIILLDRVARDRDTGLRSHLLACAPLFGLALAFGLLRSYLFLDPKDPREFLLSLATVVDGLPRVLAIFFDYFLRYLCLTPFLTVHHFADASWAQPRVWGGFLAIMALLAAFLVGMIRRVPPLATSAAIYFLSMLPLAYSLTSIDRTYAYDRYGYLALFALLWLAAHLCRNWATRLRPVPAGVAVGVLLILPLTYKSMLQNRLWSDAVGMWEHTVRMVPQSPFSHLSLGMELVGRKELAQALPHLYRAESLSAKPLQPALQLIALVEMDLGNRAKAERYFSKYLEVKPDDYMAWYELGNLAARDGEFGLAKERFTKAVTISPSSAYAWNNLGLSRLLTGDPEGAAAAFRQALSIAPGYQNAAVNLREAQDQIRHRGGRQKP